jgi:hypothetical protein
MNNVRLPRVSLSKLAEFTYASSARREAIVRGHLKPKTVVVVGYKYAEDYVPIFLKNGQDSTGLTNHISSLININGIRPSKPLKYSIDGLLALQQGAPFNFANSGEITCYPVNRNYSGGIDIDGVYVSMRPDAQIVSRKGKIVRAGTIKMHFPKSHPLNEQSGRCAAVLLHECLQNLTIREGERHYSQCFFVDVPSAQLFQAPRNYKLIMKDVLAACRQYKLMWADIAA